MRSVTNVVAALAQGVALVALFILAACVSAPSPPAMLDNPSTPGGLPGYYHVGDGGGFATPEDAQRAARWPGS